LANSRPVGLNNADGVNSLCASKDKASLPLPQPLKQQTFMQTQVASHGALKKFGGLGSGDGDDNEYSPALQYSRNQSRF